VLHHYIMNIYFGLALPADSVFDTELVSKAIFDLQCGIVPDTNRTTEHLIRAHPILPVVLSKLKLFKLSLLCKQVPCNVNVNVNLYSASSQKTPLMRSPIWIWTYALQLHCFVAQIEGLYH